MKLVVNEESCMGHGRCYRLAPEVLTYDDEGYVSIRGGSLELDDDQLDLAEELEGSCPEGAISLIRG